MKITKIRLMGALCATDAGQHYRRMNPRIVSLYPALAVALIAGACSRASLAIEPPNPEDLTQGSWNLVLDESSFCKPKPKSSKREIFDAGWGLISVYWTGVNADGDEMEARYVYRYDGDKYPASITEPAEEAITWTLVSPHRVEFIHWSKNGEKTEELVRTVSEDGQKMTQTRKYLETEDCVDTQVFQRQ